MHLYSAFHQMIILICLVMLLCAFTSGVTSHDPKKPICCTALTLHEPKMKIKSCYIIPPKGKCVGTVVFIDIINRLHCIDPKAPWLSKRQERLKKKNLSYGESEYENIVKWKNLTHAISLTSKTTQQSSWVKKQ
uniref:Chemokine ligand 34b n=1 Tax=Ctenopharyngodon idella TaxID=7959 RepID=A0A345D715_CTEID|nr:chemokine ligand 34b [Ctenopharyngodon idella]